MASAQAAEKAVGSSEAAGKSGGGSKKLVLILLPLLLAAGVGGAYFAGLLPFGGSGGEAKKGEGDSHAAGAGHDAAAEGGHGAEGGAAGEHASSSIRPLEPFLANLADENANRYLKATIQVEFANAEPPPAFEGRMPQIRDAVLTLLTSRTFADIRTPSGKEDLRDDLVDRLNHVLQSSSVKAVYFTEFIVQ
jgi:flagellar FliL protein